MNCGLGSLEGMRQQFIVKHRYCVESKEVNDKSFTYWHPTITMLKDKTLWNIGKEDQELLRDVANNFYGIISKISVESYQEEQVDVGEEITA
jgi:hypothetical protein